MVTRVAFRVAAILAILAAPLTPAGADGAVVPWSPAGISSPQWESHPAFDPVNGDFYFVRSSPAFEGWHLLMSRCTPAGWSAPTPPAFASDAIEADPWFSADGNTIYFISTRAFAGKTGRDLDIWRVKRPAGGAWTSPVRLPEPVNTSETEWFPRLSLDGWLYFGSKRGEGLGGNDIWRARQGSHGNWTAENLGPAVNTSGDEYEPLPSADGSSLLVATGDGFFVTHKTSAGWSKREKLGSAVNANGTEIGPLFSPSGRSLLFSRDTKGPESGEFFVLREGEAEAWPPECRARHSP